MDFAFERPSRLRRIWLFIHNTDHPLNCEVKWAEREGFMWVLYPVFSVGIYTGWLQPTVSVVAVVAAMSLMLLYFTALNRRTNSLQDETLANYDELCTEMRGSMEKMREIMDLQRAEILAHELRADGEGEGWKGSASLN